MLTACIASAGKARGFAFAGFMCRAQAEKGIKIANGQVQILLLSKQSQID